MERQVRVPDVAVQGAAVEDPDRRCRSLRRYQPQRGTDRAAAGNNDKPRDLDDDDRHNDYHPATTTGTASECPPGVTLQISGHTDGDTDETGQPTDFDGCL
jgi:hypothetical protein